MIAATVSDRNEGSASVFEPLMFFQEKTDCGHKMFSEIVVKRRRVWPVCGDVVERNGGRGKRCGGTRGGRLVCVGGLGAVVGPVVGHAVGQDLDDEELCSEMVDEACLLVGREWL